MKFTEILEELRKGKEVTREKWEKCKTECYKYIKLEHGEIIAYLKDNTGEDKVEERIKCMFELVDFTAEDWKIYEKPKDIKNRNWQPEEGEMYFFVSSRGSIDYTTYNSTSRTDSEIVSFGNCFKTREEAQHMLEKIKIINKLRELSNGDFYRNCTEVKYVIWYDSACKEIKINTHEYIRELPFSIYFATKKDAEKAVLTIGEDNLKKYYFDIVEEEDK